jgi:hypothetical protein
VIKVQRFRLIVVVMSFFLFSLNPAVVFGVHEEDIKDLQQRVKALEELKQEEKMVDIGGFIRFRYHISNFTDFGLLNTFDFQTQPPDKSVPDRNKTANYGEGRVRLYITPKIGDYISGQVGFEIDYRAGDSAYAVGRNAGGGLESDQTNLETKNLNVTVKFPGTNLSGTFGLQNIVDPYGGILLGWADAAGVTLNYKAADNINTLLGWYRFWQPAARLKKNVATDFWRGEVAYAPSKDLNLGFNLYALLDRTGVGATPGDPGVLGGPAFGSSSNGFAPLSYNVSTGHESLVGDTQYSFNIFMPGVNFNYKAGAVTLEGFFIYEGGKFDSRTSGVDDVTVSSFAANLGAGTKVGPFNLKLGGLYVSGDNSDRNATIGIKKRGFYTPGSYALAGAWMGLTGMKILFPDIDATNQDQYLVYDVTNTFEQKPLGVKALMLTGDTKLAKNVNFEAGIGTLFSDKKRVVNNNTYMATEVNAGVHYSPYKSFSIGVVGAYAWVGDFYEVTDSQAAAFNATKVGNPVVPNRDPADMWRIYFRTNYSF